MCDNRRTFHKYWENEDLKSKKVTACWLLSWSPLVKSGTAQLPTPPPSFAPPLIESGRSLEPKVDPEPVPELEPLP